MTLTATRSDTTASLVVAKWDGSVERTTPGYVWVLRYRLNHLAEQADLVEAVFWSRAAGAAYVKAKYGVDLDPGDPEKCLWFDVEAYRDGGYRSLILEMVEMTPVWAPPL